MLNLIDQSKSEAPSQRIALVTGSSSGFGMLATVRLAEQGYHVIATMRQSSNKGNLMDLATTKGVGQLIHISNMDVTVTTSIEETVKDIIDKYGKIDLLVNNAGYAQGGFVEEVDMDQWRSQFETNVFGTIAVTRAVLPFMREEKSGTIINLSSISGRLAFPGYAPYAASKFAIEGFSESLRLEMKPYGIHVVLVEPGAYPTNIWQKGLDSAVSDPLSPYKDYFDKVMQFSKQGASSKANPWDIADLIVRIATAKKPRLRYAMGTGARSLLAAKALLPWSWLERLIIRTLR